MISNLPNRHEQVDYALNGVQALKAILYALSLDEPFTYRLIILDNRLKDINGFQTVHYLRKLFEILNIPKSQQPMIIGTSSVIDNST